MQASYTTAPLPLCGLQHISHVCTDVSASARFYGDVLGFTFIKRPSSFDFDGAWLFGYGIGIHLIKGTPVARSAVINPKSDHLSFQCESLVEVEKRLDARAITFVRNTVEEDGVRVLQLFFLDPDNNMIEICNCDLLPIVPLSAAECAPCQMRSSAAPQPLAALATHALTDHAAMSRDAMSSASSSSSGSFASSERMSLDFDAHQPLAGWGGRGGSGSSGRALGRSSSMGSLSLWPAQARMVA